MADIVFFLPKTFADRERMLMNQHKYDHSLKWFCDDFRILSDVEYLTYFVYCHLKTDDGEIKMDKSIQSYLGFCFNRIDAEGATMTFYTEKLVSFVNSLRSLINTEGKKLSPDDTIILAFHWDYNDNSHGGLFNLIQKLNKSISGIESLINVRFSYYSSVMNKNPKSNENCSFFKLKNRVLLYANGIRVDILIDKLVSLQISDFSEISKDHVISVFSLDNEDSLNDIIMKFDALGIGIKHNNLNYFNFSSFI